MWARVAPTAVMATSCLFVARHADAHVIDTPDERATVDLAKHVRNHTRENLLRAVPYLRAMIRAPGERLATDYGGVFAVDTSASIIEEWGLCNAAIALRGATEGINPIYGKSCPSCVAEAVPDYFHTVVPLRRTKTAYRDIGGVVRDVFLGQLIGRTIDWKRDYAVGRVVDGEAGEALWFLERRRAGVRLVPRAQDGMSVEYPFEPGGTEVGTAQR